MFLLHIPGRAALAIWAVLAALLVASPAFALTTGSLRVTVVDTDMELPIPSVTVELSGENLIGGAQTRQTDADGQVLYVELPPGEYTLRADKAGFEGLTMTQIKINVNQTTVQVIELPVEGTAEEVVVEADAVAVNVESTQTGTVLTQDFLQRVPSGRSYQSAVGMAAGVTGGNGGNPNIAGAAYNENTYMLDGANITDPVTGTFSVNFNFDAIEQIEVLLGGYMPEYGQSVGGIVNVVTESGTNNLEFDTSAYYTNGNWRPRKDERITADGSSLINTGFDSQLQRLTLSSLVSGPIVRDRAWFIMSYQGTRSLINNTGIRNARDFDGHYVLAKITLQPTTEHRFSAYIQMNPTSIDNTDQTDPYTKPEAQGRQAQGGFVSNTRWQWFLNPDVNLDTALVVQKSYIERSAVPCTHDDDLGYHPCRPGEIEGNVDWETPGRFGNFGAFDSINNVIYDFDDRWRYQAGTKLSLLTLDDALGGTHDVKLGIEGVQLVFDKMFGITGNLYYNDLNTVGFDPSTFTNWYWIETSGPIIYRTTGSQWNAFVQDSWKPVSNLTINYGSRFDNFVMRNDVGDPTLTGSVLGPRLFAAWDPFKDQRTKIATGYGRFNSTGTLAIASFTDQSNIASKLYVGELFADGTAGFLSNTENLADFTPFENTNTKHHTMRTPRVDEVLLTLEREVIEDLALFSNMSGKFTRFMWEPDDVNLIFDQDGSAVIGSRTGDTLTNRYRLRTPVLAKRDYFQWDLGFRKVQSRRWTAQVTYTYTNSIGSTTEANSGSFLNDPLTQYNYGPLNTDLRHVVKGIGYWDLPTDPWTQSLGFFLEYYSGFPEERLYFAENVGGGVGGYSIRIAPRGTYFRFNPIWALGLKFRQAIDVRKGRFLIDLEVANITNNQSPELYNFGAIDSQNRLITTARQSPMEFTGGVRYEF